MSQYTVLQSDRMWSNKVQQTRQQNIVIRITEVPYLAQVLRQTGLSKQCRPRSDATEYGI